MEVEVKYATEQFNWYNDASEGWTREVATVNIDDGGKALGELIVGLLAGSAKIESIKVK